MSLMLEIRMRKVEEAKAALTLAVHEYTTLLDVIVACDSFPPTKGEYNKALEAVYAASERLERCEARVARSLKRAEWKARVFKELYEYKVIVEADETEEHALLRFLLDRE